jgi:hypothetical protein
MSATVTAGDWREQYELVRREALAADPFGPRGHGLALLLTRGVAAWLEAVRALGGSARPPSAPAPRPPSDRLPWRADDRADLTRRVASLVLTCAQEVARP